VAPQTESDKKVKFERRQLSWYVSAALYRYSYIGIAHQVDEDLFAYLGDRLEGTLAADCGCGPGLMTEKLLARGVDRILAIDHNAAMLRQLEARVPQAVQEGRVITMHFRFYPGLFSDYLTKSKVYPGYGLILFKRSLYMPPNEALSLLQAAVDCLIPGGALVVIHVERSLRQYAFPPDMKIAPYTFYHLINRFFSRLGHVLGLGEYILYNRQELVDLLTQCAQGRPVEIVPSQQRAYNLVAITG
jgi:SAM-dependent methyltransferase